MLRNQGTLPLRNLQLVVSSPEVRLGDGMGSCDLQAIIPQTLFSQIICPSDDSGLGKGLVDLMLGVDACAEGPLRLEYAILHLTSTPLPSHLDPDQSVIRSRIPPTAAAEASGSHLYKVWGAGMQLQPGEALQWPLLLHPTEAGKLTVNCLWYCEPAVSY